MTHSLAFVHCSGGKVDGSTSIEQISRVYGKQAVVVSIDPRRVWVKDPSETQNKTIKSAAERGPNGEEYCWWQCTIKGGREGRDIGAIEVSASAIPVDRDAANQTSFSSFFHVLPPRQTIPHYEYQRDEIVTIRRFCLTLTPQVAKAVEALGAGEILLNCIDKDGTNSGFQLDLVDSVAKAVSIPVIASSGAGKPEHFTQVFEETACAAALAAGIFHRGEVSIKAVKEEMNNNGIPARLS